MINEDDPVFQELARLWRRDDEAFWTARDKAVASTLAEEAANVKANRVRARRELLLAGSFPDDHVHAVTCGAQLEATPAMRYANAFLQTPARFLILVGAPGCGKTCAATWVAAEAGGPSPGFIRAAELERRGRYDRPLGSRLKACSSLVIDDLGVEVLDSKGVFRSWLDEIVDDFYGRQRILIITANLEAKDFAERYGERTISRFAQRGQFSSCGARDLRRDQLKLPTGGRP